MSDDFRDDPGRDDLDWRALLERHDADPAEDFPGWRDALHALDHDPRAREEAEAIDPLMIFRRLPEPEVDADEIAAMKAAVHSARRARAIEDSAPERSETVVDLDRWKESRWRRFARSATSRWTAAAAVVALVFGSLAIGGFRDGAGVESPVDATAYTLADTSSFQSPVATGAPGAGTYFAAAPANRTASYSDQPRVEPLARSLPLIEEIGESRAEMMQFDTDELSLVVVYTGSNDA